MLVDASICHRTLGLGGKQEGGGNVKMTLGPEQDDWKFMESLENAIVNNKILKYFSLADTLSATFYFIINNIFYLTKTHLQNITKNQKEKIALCNVHPHSRLFPTFLFLQD